jgi:hypothetical protein
MVLFLLGAAIALAFYATGYITDVINGLENKLPTKTIHWNTTALEANNNTSITADWHGLQDGDAIDMR